MLAKLKLLSALAFSLSLLSGCASEVTYERYSLSLNVAPEVFGSELLKRITVTDTLALHGGGLMMRVSDVSVVESPTNRYAQSLERDLKLLTASEILKSGKDEPHYAYRLEVSRFWGNLEGKAEVALSLSVLDEGKLVSTYAGGRLLP